jgi:hypothetical protein
MDTRLAFPRNSRAGIHVDAACADALLHQVRCALGSLSHGVEVTRARYPARLELRLGAECASWLAPCGDTLGLAARVGLEPLRARGDLESEIVLAMLLSPCGLHFASAAQFASALRVRVGIVEAARETRLDFRTHGAERPDHFAYDEERGFILREGRSLVEALLLATQPRHAGRRYSFSCWRATEYVTLLAVARETEAHHPELHARLTRQAERRALKGGAFDDTLLRVHGSPADPLPTRYFIPGDRTWFRNPDRASSEVAGFEGSYTFYLGGGRFADFWRDDGSETLLTKCLTLYHWRHALARGANGEPFIDEQRVEELVARALARPKEAERLLAHMERVQGPPELFDGGCIDPTRDHVRELEPESGLELPDVEGAARLTTLSLRRRRGSLRLYR